MKMGGWKLGSWSSNRGPDPIDVRYRNSLELISAASD